MEGIEIAGQVSPYAVAPLRILCHILKTKKIDYQVMLNGDNPWAITQLIFDEDNANFVKAALEEIMEYRCAVELGDGFKTIIRQLPFAVAMKTSDNIMAYGKRQTEHFCDQLESKRRWQEFYEINGYMFNCNPNDTVDNLEISKDEPTLRKHLIYTSVRGGYNIKTKGYEDSSLDHYSYIDSRRYD